MQCPKCGSDNVNVQVVSTVQRKKKGWAYWLLFGWLLDLMLWIGFFVFRLIVAIFKPKKMVSKVHTEAVCQNCGNHWVVKK